jgi:hypothetical protein
MPYIDKPGRIKLDPNIVQLADWILTPGDLVYVFTKLILRFLGRGWNFSQLATVLGCLEATKLELYRRKGAPYEDTKAEINGDVF